MAQFDQPGVDYQQATDRADDWSVRDCFQVLRRHAILLAVLPSVCSIAIVLAAGGRGRVFEARAMLEVQAYNDEFLGLQNLDPTLPPRADRGAYFRMELSPIQQDALLEEVSQKLLLEGRPEFQAMTDVVRNLREQIRVAALKNSNLIQIAFRSKDASVAADVVRALADTLIEKRMHARRNSLEQTASLIRLKLEALAPTVTKPNLAGANIDEEEFRSLLQEGENARVASVSGQSDIRLVALSSPEPVKPNLLLNVCIALVGGFAFAVGLVMLYEHSRVIPPSTL